MRCAAGTNELFAVNVCLHRGSPFIPFLFAIINDGFTDGNIRKEAAWQMTFADDGVVCASEKDALEGEQEYQSSRSRDGWTVSTRHESCRDERYMGALSWLY